MAARSATAALALVVLAVAAAAGAAQAQLLTLRELRARAGERGLQDLDDVPDVVLECLEAFHISEPFACMFDVVMEHDGGEGDLSAAGSVTDIFFGNSTIDALEDLVTANVTETTESECLTWFSFKPLQCAYYAAGNPQFEIQVADFIDALDAGFPGVPECDVLAELIGEDSHQIANSTDESCLEASDVYGSPYEDIDLFAAIAELGDWCETISPGSTGTEPNTDEEPTGEPTGAPTLFFSSTPTASPTVRARESKNLASTTAVTTMLGVAVVGFALI